MALTEIPIELSSTPGIVDNSNATAITIDASENVGIGTALPDAALHVVSSTVAEFKVGNIGPSNNSAIRVSRNDTTVTTGNPLGYLEFGGNDSTSNLDTAFAFVGAEASGTHAAGNNPTELVFGTTDNSTAAPVERMRIDASGNLLVNRTGDSGFGKLQVYGNVDLAGGNVLLCRDTGLVGIGTTLPSQLLHLRSATPAIEFDDSGFATVRGRIYSNEGNLLFEADYNNARANSNIAFEVDGAERMRIDASGNVEVKGGTLSIFNPALTLQQNLFVSPSTSFAYHEYPANGLIFRDTAGAEHMRINSTGLGAVLNVGGGGFTQTNYGLLGLNGANGGSIKMGTNGTVQGEVYSNSGGLNFQTPATYPMTWYPAGALAMTLDVNGDLILGSTASLSGATITTVSSGNTHNAMRNSAATAGKFWRQEVDNANIFYIINNATTGVYMNDGGTTWVAISDETVKENIVEIEGALDKVMDYRCVEYNLIADENKAKKIGFIAQDWEVDYSPVVVTGADGKLGMQYTETIPVLLKAIQEQQAIIEALTARIAALES